MHADDLAQVFEPYLLSAAGLAEEQDEEAAALLEDRRRDEAAGPDGYHLRSVRTMPFAETRHSDGTLPELSLTVLGGGGLFGYVRTCVKSMCASPSVGVSTRSSL